MNTAENTYGELVTTRIDDDLHIEQADPVIRLSTQLADLLSTGGSPYANIQNHTLTIHATNQTVAYRLTPHPSNPDYLIGTREA